MLSDNEEDWLVSGSLRWDQSLKLWRRTGKTWQQMQAIADFSQWWYRSLQFSSQGADLATVSGDPTGPVRLWHLNRQQQRLESNVVLPRTSWAVSALAFSHDGHYLAAGFGSGHHAPNDGQVLIWDLSAQPARLVAEASVDSSRDTRISRDVTALAWLPGDEVLLSGDQTGELCMWRISGNRELLRSVERPRHSRSVRSIIPSADECFLTSGDDGRVKLWSNDGAQRHEWQFDNAAQPCSPVRSPDATSPPG